MAESNWTVHRLRKLREYALNMITSQQCFEETMTELNDLFQQLEVNRHSQNQYLRGEILLATSTVLFAWESEEAVLASRNLHDAWLLAHFHRLCEFLWRTGDSLRLKETACECLIDLEESLPGLLLHKLESLVSVVLAENFYPFQSYLCLISLVLRNAATVDRSAIRRTNELLGLIKKPLLQEDPVVNLSSVDLNKLLVELMDFTPLLSTCSAHYFVSNVAEVVGALRLNPSIFKTFIHRNRSTYDLVVLDVILQLKDVFGERLFDKSERNTLIKRMVSKSVLPHYDNMLARRCLLFDWTMRHVEAVDVVYNPEFFVPIPWDAPEVEERKMALLYVMLCGQRRPQGECNILVKCMDWLFSRLDHDIDGRQITTLCELIYHFCNGGDTFSDVHIEADISRILVNVFSDHPQFTEHALALLLKFKQDKRQTRLVNSVMSSVVKCIVDMPSSEVAAADNLLHYLLFLVEAANNTQVVPPLTLVILGFISRMIDYIGSKKCFEETDDTKIWSLGHRSLEVCKSLLCLHNTNIYSSEIGEVLHQLATSHSDLDVRDRAEFYYILLTTLSPRKITALLNFHPQVQPGNYNFTHLIGSESTYSYASPVLAVSEVIFKLKRITMQFGDYKDLEEPANIEVDLKDYDYFCWLNDENIYCSADFKFELSIASDVGSEYEKLYAIVLSFSITNSSSEAQCVEILKLYKDEGGVQFAVTVVPSNVICSSLQVSVVFSREDGITCSTNLTPIALKFSDLLQPLPVPRDHGEHPNIWRRRLADKLWTQFSGNDSGKYFLSVLRVLISRESYEKLMLELFRPFITERYSSADEEMRCTIGIFLPMRNHLLLRMKYVDSGLTVHLVTDDQAVLPQINIFLRNLEQ